MRSAASELGTFGPSGSWRAGRSSADEGDVPELRCRIHTKGDGAVSYVTHDATEFEPSTHVVVETGTPGSWLLHSCPTITNSVRTRTLDSGA